jgi:type IV secretory pathway VirB10-like protein
VSNIDPLEEEGPEKAEGPEEEAQPLTGEPVSPSATRLRAEPPRVTRLSRKVPAGLGLVASIGIGGALVYALQTRNTGRAPEELYSTENRPTADGIAGLPRDYSGVPQLGPPLPGENIYDSPTGRILLVPQGTRVIGQYDNNVQFGQSRVLLVWNRLIFPNGRSIVLERQPGADAKGYAGLQDGADYHWWDLAKAAGLSTLLSVGSELAVDDDDRLVRAIRNGGRDTINDAGQQIVRRQLNVPPTLTIRPGFPVRVIVTRDLVLEPYGAS